MTKVGYKFLILLLAIILLYLQYKIWFSADSFWRMRMLEQQINSMQTVNLAAEKRNQVLMADIVDLKNGRDAVEERARNELGMVKPGETFYEVVKQPERRGED